MNLSTLDARVKAYEAAALKLSEGVAKRSALEGKLDDPAHLTVLVDAFPEPDAFEAFMAAMPATPDLGEVIKAFAPDTAELGKFVNQTLGGNVALIAALAESGCGRDAAQLKAFADAFKSDPADLQKMIDTGGFGENPQAMSALYGTGCDGDPVAFKDLCSKFATDDDREALSMALSGGGLGMAPEALGALAKEGNGAMLKELTDSLKSDADRDKLNDLLTGTVLDGGAPGRPGLLADLMKGDPDNKPERLLQLHDAFSAQTGSGAADLNTVILAMDGTDGKAGVRMTTLMDALKSRNGALTDAQIAEKLKDPYLAQINKLNVAGKTPPIGGPAATQKNLEAAQLRTPPIPAAMAGTLAQGIDPDTAGALMAASILDPATRAAMEEAAGQAAGLSAVCDLLVSEAASGDADQTDLTKAATSAATQAAAALDAKLDGGTPAEITALMELADKAVAAAALEPDTDVRTAAIAAAKQAAASVQQAMARAAAKAMAGGEAGPAAFAAQAALDALPAGLPDAVTDQATDLARLARNTAVLSAASTSGAATSDETAAAALAALKLTHGDPLDAAHSTAANEAAKAAMETAKVLSAMVSAAPCPVDQGLLKRAESAAETASKAAQGAPDAAVAKAGFEAVKETLGAIATAIRDAALRFEALALRSSPVGKAALAATGPADAGIGAADKLLVPGGVADVLSGSQGDIDNADSARTAAGVFGAKSIPDQRGDALGAATAAAKLKHGDGADAGQIDAEKALLQTQAETARDEARAAQAALEKGVPAQDPAAFNALIKTAAEKGEAAVEAARKTFDNDVRDDTLQAAKDCLEAVAKAATLPAFVQMYAAKTAKADLEKVTPAARSAALTGAAAYTLSAKDAAVLKAEAEATAYRIAADTANGTPPPDFIAAAVTANNETAQKATDAAEAARAKLDTMAMSTDTSAYAAAIEMLSKSAAAALAAAPNAVDDKIRLDALEKARECATAAANATKALALHHQTKAKEAAFAKQVADMNNTAAPNAKFSNSDAANRLNTSATTFTNEATGQGAKVTDLLARDKGVMTTAAQTKADEKALKETRKTDPTAAVPDAGDTAVAVAAANAAVTTLTAQVPLDIIALNGADLTNKPAEFARHLDTLRKNTRELLKLAPLAVDEATRDAGLATAKDGADAIVAALATAAADTATARADLEAMRKDAVDAFDRSRAAITDAAAADLQSFAEGDPAIQTLRDAAQDKQALAQLPGADQLAKLTALVAMRDAAVRLAEKTQTRFNGIPIPFPNPAPSAPAYGGTVAALPAVPANAAAAIPNTAQSDIQTALTMGKTATKALVDAIAAAEQVVIQSKSFFDELDAIKDPTTAETDTKTAVDAIKTAAAAVVTTLNSGHSMLYASLKYVSNLSSDWAAWVNTNHAADPQAVGFQMAAGFADSETDHMKFPPISEADMIRVGTSLVKDTVVASAAEPVTVNGNPAVVDMDHITDRHIRSTYKFEGHSAPLCSEHDLGHILKAQQLGKTLSKQDKQLIDAATGAKANSFFPEAVTPAKALDLATQAMTQAEVNAGGAPAVGPKLSDQIFPVLTGWPAKPPNTQNKKWSSTFHQDDNVDVSIPPTINTTIGITLAEKPTAMGTEKLKARMFYPNSGDKLSTPDVLVLSKALGVAK